MTVGEAIRKVRKGLRKNQIRFAQLLGCQQNTVSRYELGKLTPGPLVLIHLLDLADPDSAERGVFTHELKRQFGRGLFGGPTTMEEAVESLRPLLSEMQKGDAIMDLLPESKRQEYSFRQFVPAVSRVIEVCDTVDESITDMVHLWSAHWKNPAAVQYFRDALGFLRANLWRGPRTDFGPPSTSKGDDPTTLTLPTKLKHRTKR